MTGKYLVIEIHKRWGNPVCVVEASSLKGALDIADDRMGLKHRLAVRVNHVLEVLKAAEVSGEAK